jgi:hypothetical protein
LTSLFEKDVSLLFTILPSLIGGLFVYYVFGYIFIPKRIKFPPTIRISLLIFALTRDYCVSKSSSTFSVSKGNYANRNVTLEEKSENGSSCQINDGKYNPSFIESSTKLSSFLFLVAVFGMKEQPNMYLNLNIEING